jgi:hypothetical protein
MISNPGCHVVVIDTDQYAGNFEREMCAFLTGQTGECGVGKEIANKARQDIKHLPWWISHIAQAPDEHGTLRPTTIWPTPGWFNNGMGKHYPDSPDYYEKAKADAVESAKIRNETQLSYIRRRLDTQTFDDESKPRGWTKAACLRALENHEQFVEGIRNSDTRYPAYMSVGLFVNEFPPADVITELKDRITFFCEHYDDITSLSFCSSAPKSTSLRMIEYVSGTERSFTL